jgi:DNA-binding transcriptional MerR regulator
MADENRLVRRLARSSGLSRSEVRRYVRLEVFISADAPLNPALVRRLRRARRLRQDLGLSVDAVEIVLRLLDRIDALEEGAQRRHSARILD